jgi:hypothetical protein
MSVGCRRGGQLKRFINKLARVYNFLECRKNEKRGKAKEKATFTRTIRKTVCKGEVKKETTGNQVKDNVGDVCRV